MIIDWNQLELNSNSAKEISFERFCFHYASILFKGYGDMTYPYNSAGSEFYLVLQKPLEYEGREYRKGDVIGWQAKFWVNHNDLENSSLDKPKRNELVEGLRNTLKRHKDLALWIVCTPGQFLEDNYNKLKTELSEVSSSVAITHWHKAVFEVSLVGDDRAKYQGLIPYYFGKKVIGKELLDRVTSATLVSLKQKFDVDLHTASPIEDQLMGIIDRDKAYTAINEKIHRLKKRIDKYEKRWFKDDGTRDIKRLEVFGETFEKVFLAYESCVLDIARGIVKTVEETDIECVFRDGLLFLDSKHDVFDSCAQKTEEAIEGLKSSHRENYLYFYIEDILEIKDMLFGRRDDRSDSIEHTLRLRESRYFPIFAQAGYGKTHFACSLATEQLKNGQPVLLLTGNRFRHCFRPQDVFLNILGFEGSQTSFEDAVCALDLLASCYPASRLLIVIDGLNESFPNERVWSEEMPTILKNIEGSENLILITTCREKSEYIQKIFGLQSYEKVDNSSLLKGIDEFNLAATIHRYFRKYNIEATQLADKKIFINPLLLKIFCETNQGAKGMVVNEHSLVESMKRYSDNLVSKLSVKDGAVSKIISHQVRSGLVEMGRLLWERNTRDVDYFDDFYPLFGEQSEALLEEGICFQVETLNTDGGEVKFTYDLLAGYHIAQYLLSKARNEVELNALLNEKDVYKKIFGTDDELHTLSEDILKTLIFAVREREHKSLIEFVGGNKAFAKILENLGQIKATEEESRALLSKLSQPMEAEVKKTVGLLVKQKLLENHTVRGISILLPAFKQFSPEEFDLLFHELFLPYGTIFEAVNCVKNALKDSDSSEDAILAAVLLSGCFWTENRQKVIRFMTDYAVSHFEELTSLLPEYLKLNDPFIREALYILINGATVGFGNRDNTATAIRIISDDLKRRPTSNIIILDYAECLFDYAKKVFSMDVEDSVLLLITKDTQWGTVSKNDVWKSGVYNYDFEKYHIRPYSIMGYDSHSSYTSDQLSDMILWKMRQNGYRDDVYAEFIDSHRDRIKYYQPTVNSIPFKHVGTAQKELVGWLMINDEIEPEYKHTMRTTEIDIDPAYPTLHPKRQLISVSFLPRTVEEKEGWLAVNPLGDMKKYLTMTFRGDDSEWVLLRSYLSQKNDEKQVQIYWATETGLAYNKTRNKTVELPAARHSHLLASEIGWREMEYNGDDYYEPSLGMFLLQHYEFTGWDKTRAKNCNFYFLSDQIRKDFGLDFNVRELRYYWDGKGVTEYYQDNHSEFYYLRKDLLEEILKRYKVTLVTQLYAEKTDTHREKGQMGYRSYNEYREKIVGLK